MALQSEQRGTAPVAGAREGRDSHGGGGHREHPVGPPRQAGEQASVEGAGGHDTGADHQSHRLHVSQNGLISLTNNSEVDKCFSVQPSTLIFTSSSIKEFEIMI